jgi:hypothetical protein
MSGRIVGIYTTAVAGAPMQSLPSATIEPGKGLLGDRYAAGAGTFSKTPVIKPDAEITLIEDEEVSRFNEMQGLSVAAGDLRRNIVSQGIRLNDLVGRRFRVGDALLEGMRLCEPCAHLSRLVSDKVLPGLVHRAGLRARILRGAVIRPGDVIQAEAAG